MRARLAGRFERLTLGHWTARDLAESFTISAKQAAHAVVTEGAFPGAFPLRTDRARWHAYVRDAVLEPALGRDLLALGAVRRPALLRQVFGVAAGSPAQIVSLQKIQGTLQDRGALETAREPERFGAWVENACLAHAANAGQRQRDLVGLFEFVRRHPRFRPLVLCDGSALGVARDAGAEALAWEEYLLVGPPNA